MITIGQLARYAGVSVKTVRVYHAKGLLSEPARDASGYRRYTAQDAIDLIKVRTLAEAGVPLARIGDLLASDAEEFTAALERVDADLSGRIEALRSIQRRLRDLRAGPDPLLPPAVAEHVRRLREHGFSAHWIQLVSDLWVLTFATHPDVAADLIADQDAALDDRELRQIFLDYDRAYALEPDDPRIDALAARMVEATAARYGPAADLPEQRASSEVPALIQASVNQSSPSWARLDVLVRHGLAAGD
jgi:DNA-binding transcriptional MerR regulator